MTLKTIDWSFSYKVRSIGSEKVYIFFFRIEGVLTPIKLCRNLL